MPLRPPVEGFFALQAKVGERGLVFVGLPPAVGVVQALLGTEGFALAMMDAPEQVLELLWTFQARLEDLARYLLSQGVGPLFSDVGAEYAGPPVMSPRFFRLTLHTRTATHRGGELLDAGAGRRGVSLHLDQVQSAKSALSAAAFLLVLRSGHRDDVYSCTWPSTVPAAASAAAAPPVRAARFASPLGPKRFLAARWPRAC